MLNKKALTNVGYCFFYILLALTSMNFQLKFFYFVFAATVVCVIFFANLKIDMPFFSYLLLSVIISAYNVEDGIVSMIKFLAYAMAYYIGYSAVVSLLKTKCEQNHVLDLAQKRMYRILATLSLGSFAHYIMNYFLYIRSGGGTERNTFDIWSESVLSATGQAALACLMLGFAVAMILTPLKKSSVWIGVVFIVGILMYNLVLSGRTLLVILFAVAAVGLAYVFYYSERRGQRLKLFGVLLFLTIAFLVIWVNNIGGIKDIIENSNFYSRFFGEYADDIRNVDRGERKLNFLNDMLYYPFGGTYMRDKYGYAHDLLLDGYDEYGVFAFIALIAILISGLRNLYIFIKNKNNSLSVRTAFFCVYISLLLEFCVEPILAGMQWLFVCYCIINGLLSGYNSLTYKNKKVEKI